MSADYDSPWKEALDNYFEWFLALLFPEIHRQIDWSRGHESLDKEFQQVVREAEVGRRYVDKLVKVWTKDGVECWVLIHVEVQTARETDFPQRMYVYNYRIFDRYNKPVASLAVLADDDPTWRPQEFRSSLFGCEASIRFPSVKLLDFAAHEAVLEASNNPFAIVVLAHLKARQTHGNLADRQAWKVRLVRGLYERGFSAKDVRELFRVIDWLMELPPGLEEMFQEQIDKFQQEKRMPFITSIERVGLRRGLRSGIESFLRVRFGEEGLKLMPEIQEIYEEDKLEAILKALETATGPDEVRRLVLDTIQDEKRMPFITSSERLYHARGLRQGIETSLRIRFGAEGVKLMPEIQEIYEEDKLLAILKALETAPSPDEVRRLWSPGTA